MRRFTYLALIAVSMNLSAEVVVVANPELEEEKSDGKIVQQIFLGKRESLPNGGDVEVIEQDNDAVKAEFHKKFTQKTTKQLNAYWSRLVFAGKAILPNSVSDDAAVIEAIKKDPKKIGYLKKESVKEGDGVKVVAE